jgi:hypothetical protein
VGDSKIGGGEMTYKKLPVKGYKRLGLYPVYVDALLCGKEPLKIVGIRENQVELEGDFSGGTHCVTQSGWFPEEECFVIHTVCLEQLKPNGCQVHNLFCCAGGSLLTSHVNYWDNLIIKEPQP